MSQIQMSYKEFLNQQFDQFFSYSTIQKCILSADSLLSADPKIHKNLGMIDNKSNPALLRNNTQDVNDFTFIDKSEMTPHNHHQKSKQSFNYNAYFTVDQKYGTDSIEGNISFIEFDLILTVVGIELNVISLKKQKKSSQLNAV